MLITRALKCTSVYKTANSIISVTCTRCGHTMTHKTPHEWLCKPSCYYCDMHIYNPNVEDYNDYVQRITNGQFAVLSSTWNGAKARVHYRCNEHQMDFFQSPDSFRLRSVCPMCISERRKKHTKSHDVYLSEMSKVSPNIEVIGRYRASAKPIAVRCRTCNYEWTAAAGVLLAQATQCPICSGVRVPNDQYRSRIRKISPGIQIVGKFDRNAKRTEVRCRRCGNTWVTHPAVLLRGCKCKKCSGNKAEKGNAANEKPEKNNRTI